MRSSIAGLGMMQPHVAVATSSEIIQHLADLDPLADAWDSLGATLASPMQHYIWARTAIETFCAPNELRVVTVGPAHQPTAVAPLVRRRRVLPRWELLSMTEVYAPMDFLYADSNALAALVDALVKLQAPLWLKRVPADSPVVAMLQDAYRGSGWVITRPDDGCPWIPLDRNWLKPEQQLNPGRRSDFRRAQRNAEKMGAVTYEVLSPTLEELGPLLEEAYRIEAASWKGAAGTALVYDGIRKSFFTRYAMAACEKGILRLCFLRINGEGAAMQLAAECGGALWLLRVAYDRRFADCSPGMLLMLHTIQYAAARLLRSYELLGPPMPWMNVVTRLTRPCVWLRAYPISVKGVSTLTADTAWLMWLRSRKLLRKLLRSKS